MEYHTGSAYLSARKFVRVDAYWGLSSAPWSSTIVNFVMKSTITCPFLAVRSWCCMSNSLNSTAYNANSPTASGLLIAFRKGLSIRMIIVCAWKYGLSFRAAVTNAKVSFSIGGYLSFAPQNTQLVKYTGFYTPFSSLTKATLTAAREMARYRNNASPGFNELSNRGEERYVFRTSKAC